ncbi:hypothetical protein, partial [Staphylococcus warneri]|uniref:hypothetical protein n=1 Tax=Staphylococcus warneri TaxID=1292 RepID=UPI001C92DD9B
QNHLYHLPSPKNMLNVILLHFPPIDTLFQSSLLAIPPLPIYTIIKLRVKHQHPSQTTHVKPHQQTEKSFHV